MTWDAVKLILSLSLSGSLLMLALLFATMLLRRRISRQWQYYIWIAVLLRLLLPFTSGINLIGYAFERIAPTVAVEQVQSDAPMQSQPLSIQEPSQRDTAEPSTPVDTTAPVAPMFSMPDLPVATYAFVVWLTVALAMMVRKITLYQGFVRYVKAGWEPVSDIDTLNRFGHIQEQAGVRRMVELCTSRLISTPILIGFLRPCIVLPEVNPAESDFRFTVLHELTHYKRGDMFYKWLVQLTICLHWFNPLIYLMGRAIDRACELSCDEAVICALDHQGKQAYGDTLLNAMWIGGHYTPSIASVTLHHSKRLLKERLEAIMLFQKKSKWIAVLTVMLSAVILCGAVFAGAYPADDPVASPSQSPNAADVASPNVVAVASPTAKPTATPTPKAQVINVQPAPSSDNKLTWVEKSYSKADLKSMNISGVVVEGVGEHISITTAGQSLAFKYQQAYAGEYTLEPESDMGGKIQELALRRVTSKDKLYQREPSRMIYVTIPEGIDFAVVVAETVNGSIDIKNCVAKTLKADTLNGNISISGGEIKAQLFADSLNGNIRIADTKTSDGFVAHIDTLNGNTDFYPIDSAWNYKLVVDMQLYAKVTINDQTYKGGDYIINDSGSKTIYLDGLNGSLTVRDREYLADDAKSHAPKKNDVIETKVEVKDSAADMQIATIGKAEYHLIDTEQQLRSIGKGQYRMDANYLLNGDITLTGEWVPIGTADQPFTGTFDGNGFEIIDLKITDPKAKATGLFGYAKNAKLQNIKIRNYYVEITEQTPMPYLAPCTFSEDCEISNVVFHNARTNNPNIQFMPPTPPTPPMPVTPPTQFYAYTQRGYYQEPYIIELGWNLQDDKHNTYATKANVALKNGESIAVLFNDSCIRYAKDDAALSAIGKLIERISSDSSNNLPIRKPYIVSMIKVPADRIPASAEEYYTNDELTYFCALYPELSDKAKKAYAQRMFDDERINYFSIALKDLDSAAISGYAKQAFEQERIDFFSILLNHLDTAAVDGYASKAYERERIDFFTVTISRATADTKAKLKQRAEKDGRKTFLHVLGK